MEKDVKIIFCLSLVLILSLSLVSAGWFSDFFGKITGQATSECSLLGDVNYDGVLDCKDVALIIEMDAELIPIDLCGDFSKNGYVSSYDSALLMKDYNLPCSGCISQTCELLNKQCGSWEGGCGTILNCGNCETNYQCEEGICVENPCPLKGDVNYDGVLDCEDVVLIQQMDAELIEPDLCGDISNNDKVTSYDASLLMTQIGNNCEGCHPLTCSDLVKQCGSWSDGCGGNLNCGSCKGGYICNNSHCEFEIISPNSTVVNNCSVNQIFHQGFCKPRVINLELDYNFSEIQTYGKGDGGVYDPELFSFNYGPLVNKANELVSNKNSNYDKVYAISNYIYNSKIYDSTYNVPVDSIAAYLDVERGKCFHAAILTQAMFNMIGIPALHYDTHLGSTLHAQTLAKIDNVWGVIDTTFFKSSLTQEDINITLPTLDVMKNVSMFITGDDNGMNFFEDKPFCNVDETLCLNNQFYMLRVLINPLFEKKNLYLPLIKNFYIENDDGFERRYYGCILQLPYNCAGGCYENEIKPKYNVKIGPPFVVQEISYRLFSHEKETKWDSPSLAGKEIYQFIGYAKTSLPKSNLNYKYLCYRLDPSQWSSEAPTDNYEVANYNFTMSGDIFLTWDKLQKSSESTQEEFDDVKNYIKSVTEDLGIFPFEEEFNESGCEGCFLNEECFGVGDRNELQYCSENGLFFKQKLEGFSCQNNYECQSNLCLNGNCKEENIIEKEFKNNQTFPKITFAQKIKNFFQNIFKKTLNFHNFHFKVFLQKF